MSPLYCDLDSQLISYRFNAITNEQSMPRMHSLLSHMAGIVQIKVFSTTANHFLESTLHMGFGRVISHLSTLSSSLDSRALVNFLKLRPRDWMTRGNMGRICMGFIMTCWDSCQTMLGRRLASGSQTTRLPVKSRACW